MRREFARGRRERQSYTSRITRAIRFYRTSSSRAFAPADRSGEPEREDLTPMADSITVDHQPLSAEQFGLKTVGQVLAHIQRDNRLVVHVLIDGQEPDLDHLGVLRQSPLRGHTLYIETAEPRQMALDVLDEVEFQLDEADQLRAEAVDLLLSNQTPKALEKLQRCFTTW